MKVSEAEKELSRYVNEPYSKLHPYFTDAVKLGIEALKALQNMRKAEAGTVCTQLHGETPEDNAT